MNELKNNQTRMNEWIKQTSMNELTKFLFSLSLFKPGDAAFAGQGVVYETMQLSGVPGFTTGKKKNRKKRKRKKKKKKKHEWMKNE